MCGIAGIHVLNPEKYPGFLKMEKSVDSLLSAIDHRGGDATGFVAMNDEATVEWQKASCKAWEFYSERRNLPTNTRSVLLHTRMATQGSAAFPENNHPVRRGSVYVVHNGHIWNDIEVFRKANRTRYAQVDSEAIAAIISKFGVMNTEKAMEEVMGAAAIGVIDESKPGLMVLARGSSSPLMFYHNEDIAVFASTKDAIKRAWTILYGTPPSEKNIEDVEEGTVLYLDGSEIHRRRFVPDDFYVTSRQKTVTITKPYESWSNPGRTHTEVWDAKQGKYVHKETSSDWDEYWNQEWCVHMCREQDCEICNPDDMNGSYLPTRVSTDGAKMRSEESGEWVSAKACDLCGTWEPEDALEEVTDWDDASWEFCESCMNELSEVIAENGGLKSSRRNRSILDEPLEGNPLVVTNSIYGGELVVK